MFWLSQKIPWIITYSRLDDLDMGYRIMCSSILMFMLLLVAHNGFINNLVYSSLLPRRAFGKKNAQEDGWGMELGLNKLVSCLLLHCVVCWRWNWEWGFLCIYHLGGHCLGEEVP